MRARYKYPMWTVVVLGGMIALIVWQSISAGRAEISSVEYDEICKLIEEQPLLSEVVMAEYKNDGRIDRYEISTIRRAYYDIKLRAAKWRLEDAARVADAKVIWRNPTTAEGGAKIPMETNYGF